MPKIHGDRFIRYTDLNVLITGIEVSLDLTRRLPRKTTNRRSVKQVHFDGLLSLCI